MPLGATELGRVGAARRHGLGRWLLLGNVAVLALLAALATLVLLNAHAAYERRAIEQADTIAASVQAAVGTDLSQIDMLLGDLLQELVVIEANGRLPDAAVDTLLASHRQLQPVIETFGLIDADGIVRHAVGGGTSTPVDVHDRDYFQRLRDDPATGHVVVGPLVSRRAHHDVLLLARRKARADGTFDGVLYATVPVDHFDRLFQRLEIGGQDSVALRTDTMKLVARYAPGSAVPYVVGDARITPALADALRRDPARGSTISRAAIDGIERANVYRRVEGYPFVVIVGLGTERFFAPWRREATEVTALGVVVAGLILAASWAIFRAWRREARSLHALSLSTRRTRTLLRAAADGLLIVDAEGHVIEASDSIASMLRREREGVVGHRVTEWDVGMAEEHVLAWIARARDGEQLSLDTRYRRSDGELLDVELRIAGTRAEGVDLVCISARDVTEHRQLLARVSEQGERIRDLYDHAPCAYYSLDADGRFVVVNATLLSWIGCTAEEVVGRLGIADFFDDESRARFAETFPRYKASGRLEGIEFTLVSRDGTRRRVRASVSAIRNPDGSFRMSRSVLHDVSALHEAREDAARLLRDQEAMLDNELVAMLRLRGRTIAWKNRAVQRLFGHDAGALLAAPVRVLFADDASFDAVLAAAEAELGAGRSFHQQLPMRHRDGSLLWIDMSAVSLSDGESLWMMVDVTPMKQAHEQVERIAFHDVLTGLPNRLLLQDRLAQALRIADRAGGFIAVCFVDLDGFKQVNDAWGHDAGDALLREVARRLQADLRGNDTAARLGGDEFVLVLTHLVDTSEALGILERLLDDLGRPVTLPDGRAVRIGASIGVALHPDHGADAHALLMRADRAMFEAKRAGKNRVVLAAPEADATPA